MYFFLWSIPGFPAGLASQCSCWMLEVLQSSKQLKAHQLAQCTLLFKMNRTFTQQDPCQQVTSISLQSQANLPSAQSLQRGKAATVVTRKLHFPSFLPKNGHDGACFPQPSEDKGSRQPSLWNFMLWACKCPDSVPTDLLGPHTSKKETWFNFSHSSIDMMQKKQRTFLIRWGSRKHFQDMNTYSPRHLKPL